MLFSMALSDLQSRTLVGRREEATMLFWFCILFQMVVNISLVFYLGIDFLSFSSSGAL